jgi:hypothetical protein
LAAAASFTRPLSWQPKVQALAHIHPRTAALLITLRCSLALAAGIRFSARLRSHVTTTAHREPLCTSAELPRFALRSRHKSAGITPPSSLLRAHAPDRHPPVGFGCPYSSRSLQVVPSPCCIAALPDVISAILARSSGSVPRHGSAVHSSVSSRRASASPKGQRTRPVRFSRNAVLCGGQFRGCNHSLMFRLPDSLGSPTAHTVQLSPSSIRALYTGLYTRRYRRELRHRFVSESGQLTR